MMGEKVQGVTVTWINTSSMGPYALGLLRYQELRSFSKETFTNGTGLAVGLLII